MPLVLLAVGMAIILGGILWLRLHPFLALVLGALTVATLTPADDLRRHADSLVEAGSISEREARALASMSAGTRVASEFGIMAKKVGIIISMAAIIGQCMLASGAAQRIIDAVLNVFGAARAALAFVASGFFLGVPVYFDTVFYLLMPVGRALYAKTHKNHLLNVMAIVAGATMAHSLIPPTPGPITVAEMLGVNIGTMIVAGSIVGLCAVSFGYCFARWKNARNTVTPTWDDDEFEGGADAEPAGGRTPGGEACSTRPNLGLAVLPVLLPVLLITGGTALSAIAKSDAELPAWLPLETVKFFADKNVALTLSALIALATLWRFCGDRNFVKSQSGAALASGATILLITAAGGAFGGVLRQTGIALDIQHWGGGANGAISAPLLLSLVFVVTALVRTAQGSATVAMVTAAPIAAVFAEGGALGFHPVYLALAIGCGSKPFPWMNDSGFWVITKMGGLKESETLRHISVMMSLMGVVGLVVTIAGAVFLPMR